MNLSVLVPISATLVCPLWFVLAAQSSSKVKSEEIPAEPKLSLVKPIVETKAVTLSNQMIGSPPEQQASNLLRLTLPSTKLSLPQSLKIPRSSSSSLLTSLKSPAQVATPPSALQAVTLSWERVVSRSLDEAVARSAHLPVLPPSLPPSASSQTARAPIPPLNYLAISLPETLSPQTTNKPAVPDAIPTTASLPVVTPQFVSNSTVTPLPIAPQNSPSSGVATTQSLFDDTYLLGAGDRLQFNLFNVPEYSGEQQVLADGSLNLPVIGRIQVSGLSLRQAEAAIAAQYGSELRHARVTINLLRPRPLQIAVAGEVKQPGLYTLNLPEEAQFPSLAQAIQAAGGVVQSADLQQIQIRRSSSNGTTQTTVVNLQTLLQRGDASQNIALRDGDQIYIPATATVNLEDTAQLAASNLAANTDQVLDVAVVGQVNRPGAYKLGTAGENTAQNNGTRPTITQAIQTAGGITPSADIRQIMVLRNTRSGEQKIAINLRKLLESGDLSQDLILQQGDRIMIPTATAPTAEEVTQLTTANLSPEGIQVNVVGEVKTPGAVKVAASTTLNQAILAAGGLNQRSRQTVRLIRINPNGTLTEQQIRVDLSRAVDATNNPILWNNDVIVVGRSAAASFSDGVDNILNPLLRLVSPFQLLF